MIGNFKKTKAMDKYKIYRIYSGNSPRRLLRKGLTLEEAKRVVKSYKSTKKSMVVFTKQK